MSESESTIRVLHVDDEPEFGDLVEIYLERENDALDVTTAADARAALDRLGDDEFDCVVSDYNMSELDGLELLNAVREDHPDLPFVLFTGKGSEEIASKAISEGVTDYLQKETGTDQYAVLANRIVNAVDGRRSERALAESKQRYQTLVEESQDGIFILQEGTLAFANDRACEITGYDRSELEGTSLSDIVRPDDRERVRDVLARTNGGRDAAETNEIRVRTKSGDVRRCELRVQDVARDGNRAVLGVVRDVSERRAHEQTLETLHDGTRELMRAETRREVCEIAVETARTELELPITGIWLYDEAANRLDPVTSTDESEPVVGSLPTFEPDNSLAWTAFEEQESAVFDDVRDADPVYDPDTEIRSEVIVPLGEEGVLVSGSTTVERFDDLDREFLELLATNAQAALERADREAAHRRMARKLRRSKQKIEQLHEVATEIESCGSEREICDLTVEAAERILEFDICVVDIEADGLLQTRSTSSEYFDEDPPPMSVEEGIAGKTYRTGESFRFDDVRTASEAAPRGEYLSAISVAIGDHGVFQAVAHEVGFFDEADVELAELLVSHAAEALTRVEREQQLRRSESRLRRQKDRFEEFASIVSHDLRNPLNVAQGNVDLVLDDTVSARSGSGAVSDRELLAKAATALDRMEEIVHDVLTLARQGKDVDDPEIVGLEAVARRAWANVETATASLRLDCDRRYEADPKRLQQLLENLFRNSVEHGGSNVAVRVRALEDGFAVADDGPGIPEADREAVFSSGYSTADDGTGFGLAIVDRIVEAHGWTVSVADGPSGGAQFEIRDVVESIEE